MNRLLLCVVVASSPGCLLLEPECSKPRDYVPLATAEFDDGLDGFTVGATNFDGMPVENDGTWSVTHTTEKFSCGLGALEFNFTAAATGTNVYIERMFELDTTQGFYLNTGFDFGTLDIAGAQGWTWELSARTAEAFDSEVGVKQWSGGATSKDDSEPGWRWVARGPNFNLEPSTSNKVWVRFSIRVGSTDSPRNRKYYLDHFNLSPPEPR